MRLGPHIVMFWAGTPQANENSCLADSSRPCWRGLGGQPQTTTMAMSPEAAAMAQPGGQPHLHWVLGGPPPNRLQQHVHRGPMRGAVSVHFPLSPTT